MSLTKFLPWRLQSIFGYRPISTNFKDIRNVLPQKQQERLPVNGYKVVAKGYDLELKAPLHYVNDFRHHFFIINEKLPVESVIFAGIKNGRYIQCNFVPSIISSKNIVLDGAQRHAFYYNPWKSEYKHPIMSVEQVQPKTLLKGNVLCLATDGAHNGYYHFLTRLTAKLAVLKDLNIDLKEFSHILVNGPSTKYKQECLQAAGVAVDQVIYANENEHFEAENLFFIPRIRFHKLGTEFVRDIFLNSSPDYSQSSKNIYISRKDAKHRFLLEESELLNCLNKHNFTSVQLSQYSVKEQAQIFNDARNIVGLHGAGLANIIFAKTGTRLFEIYDDEFVNVNYWFYANLVGVEYIPVIGRTTKGLHNYDRKGFDNISINKEIIHKISRLIK